MVLLVLSFFRELVPRLFEFYTLSPMVRKYLSSVDLVTLMSHWSEVSEEKIITDENAEEVKELYRKSIGPYKFRPEHDKYMKLKVLSPIMIYKKMKRPRREFPDSVIVDCYYWFGCMYGETVGDSSGSDFSEGGGGDGREEKGDGSDSESGSDFDFQRDVSNMKEGQPDQNDTVDTMDQNYYE